jgi:hypothetical protein
LRPPQALRVCQLWQFDQVDHSLKFAKEKRPVSRTPKNKEEQMDLNLKREAVALFVCKVCSSLFSFVPKQYASLFPILWRRDHLQYL